jgi:hypothetical protein
MQYKVPQNVDIEDKVIGPLTLRQFIIILVGVGTTLVLYFMLAGFLSVVFWFLAMLLAAATFGLAFGKYGDQKPEIFLISAFKTISKPRQRIWKKEEDLPQITQKAKKEEPKKEEENKKNIEEERDDLEKLAQLVDSGGYSNISTKDRVIAVENKPGEESEITDSIKEDAKNQKEIDGLMKDAEKSAPKREPLLSEIAKVSPAKRFDYPEIALTDDKFLNRISKPPQQ